MKYLVVSDNHGDRDCLVDLADTYKGKVDGMFHCGDSELEPTDTLWQDFIVVTGNCDFDPRFKREQLVDMKADKIFIAHGHLLNVNQTLNNLVYRAKEVGATVAFYGHTHKLGVERIDDILLLNPGSISQPRGMYSYKTYAIVESTESGYNVSYFERNHKCIEELSRSFRKD